MKVLTSIILILKIGCIQLPYFESINNVYKPLDRGTEVCNIKKVHLKIESKSGYMRILFWKTYLIKVKRVDKIVDETVML